MLKFMFAGRRAPGRSRAGALRHLRTVHGPMVVCPPPGAGDMPRGYVQNHVIDGAYPGEGSHAIERDLVTILWFDSIDQMRAAVQTPYYLSALRPDEPNFVDDSSVAKMMVIPTTVREGDTGAFKLFYFLGDDRSGGELDPLLSWIDGLAGAGKVIDNRVVTPPDGSAPFVAHIIEVSFMQQDHAEAALDRIADALAASHSGVDRSKSFAVIAEEYDSDRLIAEHRSKAASQ